MGEQNSENKVEVASTRLDKAIDNLEAVISQNIDQDKIIFKLQNEIENLLLQKSKLSSDLIRSTQKEKILDKSADEVSKQLVDAMETIKSVLVK